MLDDHMPTWDVRERHAMMVEATPADTLAAARSLTGRDVPLAGLLMAIRTLPGLLRGRLPRISAGREPVLASATGLGFVVLEETNHEIVLGLVGRFWTPAGSIRPIRAEEFVPFVEPGFAKAAVNFEVLPHGTGSLLLTETRIEGTDDAARRSFRRYWRLVYPGSAAIRIAWLLAIRRKAEESSSS